MVTWGGIGSGLGSGYLDAQQQSLQAQLQRQKLLEFNISRAGDALAGQAFGIQNQPQQPQQQFGGVQPPQGGGMPAQASPGMAPPPTQQGVQPQMASLGVGAPSGGGNDPRGLAPFIQQEAQKYGIDPAVAMRVAMSEGLRQFTSGIPGENSFGAFQLNTQGGMGNQFQRDTGLDPRDPKNEKATIDYALQKASQGGWGPFHGAHNTGIGQWQGIGGGQQPQGQGGLGPQQQFAQQGIPPTPAGRTFDWALSRLNQVAPNAPPEVKLRALAKMLPLMAPDAREQFLYTMQMLRQQGQQDVTAQRGEQASGLEAQKQAGRQDLEGQRQEGRTDLETQKEKARLDELALKGDVSMSLEDRRQQHRLELAEINNTARAAIKSRTGQEPTMKDDVAEYAVDRMLAGEKLNAIVPGYGATAAANREFVTEHLQQRYARGEISADAIANAQVALGGKNQAEKVLKTMAGRMSGANEELKAEVPQALDALKQVEAQGLRSRYPTWNSFINATEEQLGDPNIVRLQTALKGVAAAYAGVLRRGQGLTVESQKSADALLQKKWSEGQLEASMQQMIKEGDFAESGVRKAIEKNMGESTTQGKQPAGGGDTTAPEKRTSIEPGSKGPLPDQALKALQDAKAAGQIVDPDKLIEDGWKLTPEQDRALRLNFQKPTSPLNTPAGLPVTDSLGTRG